MDERQTSLEWILDGDPLFKILLGLFGVWVGFAIVVLTGRAKPNPCLVAPFFVLPLILLGGGLLYFFVLSMMCTDTLGTTGGRLEWLEAHVATERYYLGYSVLIIALGLVSGLVGWTATIVLLFRSRKENRRP